MHRPLRLVRPEDLESSSRATAPDAADVRELAHRLYEQRNARPARAAQPQPALDWFLSLVFRSETETSTSEQPRIRRAA